MDARFFRSALVAASLLSLGASYRTPNFVVTAPTERFAKQVGDSAEEIRRELAEYWLGKELPNWSQPCPIMLQVGPNLGAGGATSFLFERGEVYGWRMEIQGSEERILDSVLPHEVTHTIFASHFRQPLPRWADEGACTTVEHPSERMKQQKMLVRFLQSQRGIPFSSMFAMKEYPADIMPLYSQGYSLARYLIEQGGPRKFMNYVRSGLASGDWRAATDEHYGFESLAVLQDTWLDWVRQGSPKLETAIAASEPPQPGATALAGANPASQPDGSEIVVRGQNQSRLAEFLGKLSPLRRSAIAASRPKVPELAGDPTPPSAMAPGTSALAAEAPRGSVYGRASTTATPAPNYPAAAPGFNRPAPIPPRAAAGAVPQGSASNQVLLEWNRSAAAPSPQPTLRRRPVEPGATEVPRRANSVGSPPPIYFDAPAWGHERLRR